MAYDKGNGRGGFDRPRSGGGSFQDRPRTEKGYRRSPGGKPLSPSGKRFEPRRDQQGKPEFEARPQRAQPRPAGQRPDYRRDEAFSGESTRPQRRSMSDQFFGKGGPPGNFKRPANAYPAGRTEGPQGPGPRRAAPSARPVPPAVRDDAPRNGGLRPVSPPREYERPARSQQPFRPGKPLRQGGERVHPRAPEAPLHPIDQPEAEQQRDQDNLLVGRNPIREAIKAGRQIDKLLVAEGDLSGSARQIVAWAREARIVVQHVDRARLDEIYPNHQGMIAIVPAAQYSSVEQILEYAEEKGEPPFVVVLDSITDPHNLGAVIRTAECAGAHGVIIPERRSAGLNPAAVKASAGACEYQRIAKVVNLSRALEQLKQAGLWVIGADMQGEPVGTADLSGAIALVIGSEGDGLSSLVQKSCDKLVALPIKGKIDSLNASVAAGVLMYEVLRARGN